MFSSQAFQDQVQERDNPCAHCHREAFYTIMLRERETRLCPSCWAWAAIDNPPAEPVPEPEPDVQGPCEDCHTREAETVFYSLDGRRAQLCIPCSTIAEQDDDRNMFCMCSSPSYGLDGVRCTQCYLRIQEALVSEVGICAQCGENEATMASCFNESRYCADCFWELRDHYRRSLAIGAGAGSEEEDSDSDDSDGGDPCVHCGRDGQHGLCQYCEWARHDRKYE